MSEALGNTGRQQLEHRYARVAALPLLHGLCLWAGFLFQPQPSTLAESVWFVAPISVCWLAWPCLLYRDRAWSVRSFLVSVLLSGILVAPALVWLAGWVALQLLLWSGARTWTHTTSGLTRPSWQTLGFTRPWCATSQPSSPPPSLRGVRASKGPPLWPGASSCPQGLILTPVSPNAHSRSWETELPLASACLARSGERQAATVCSMHIEAWSIEDQMSPGPIGRKSW